MAVCKLAPVCKLARHGGWEERRSGTNVFQRDHRTMAEVKIAVEARCDLGESPVWDAASGTLLFVVSRQSLRQLPAVIEGKRDVENLCCRPVAARPAAATPQPISAA